MRRRFINKETNYKPLGIKALEDNTTVIYNIEATVGKLFIRLNKGRWQPASSYSYGDILINKGEQIEFAGSLKIATATPNGVLTFQIDKNVELIGTPMSILKNEELHSRCFAYMFYGCKITSVPEDFLPSKSVFTDCYLGMFSECTELTKAPVLLATTLAQDCYKDMFYGCSKLNYIKMLATDISATNCLSYWVNGVASTGTFVKNPEATWDVVGVSGVPNGWTVKFDGDGSVMPIVLNATSCSDANSYTTPPSDNPNAKKLYEELMLLSNNTGQGNLDVGLVTIRLTSPLNSEYEKLLDVTSYSLVPTHIAEGILLCRESSYQYYVLQQDGTIQSVFYD